MLSLSQVEFRYSDGANGADGTNGANAGFTLGVSHLQVEAGECVALTGPSGSGKTTLLHLAAGILVPRRGRVMIGDFELSAQSDSGRRRHRLEHLGLVFQSFELLAHLSARDNIELPSRLSGRVVEGCLDPLVETLGLAELLGRHPAQLSQGECQRVAIARALLHRPSLVLADEPTGNLDATNKRTVVELLLAACRKHKAAVLMATHDLDLLGMFDRSVAVSDLAHVAEASS